MKPIHQIIDHSFQKMKADFFPMTAMETEVPEEMIDSSTKTEESYIGWKPIPSKITDKELLNLELALKCKLPKSYKEFLQYQYFMELHLPDIAIKFPSLLPKSRLEILKEMNLAFNIPKQVIGKGYFYFADFYDFGLLTFDTNTSKKDNDFEVIFMSHNNLENKHVYANSFIELMNFDKNQSNRFIERLNVKNKN